MEKKETCNSMLNFTVGPVLLSPEVMEVGAEQVPYFRTPEFSAIMKENERLVKKFAHLDESGRVVFLTASGTGAMEATVMNVLSEKDKVLVINGGSFGHRFVQLCQIHNVPYTEIIPEWGYDITDEQLEAYNHQGYTALLVNIDETSTGVLYDIDRLTRFCQENNSLLIVDAISSFLADPLDMHRSHIDVMIAGSQKALACPPGISLVAMSEKAVQRVENHQVKSMYFDLKDALKNAERGQTPFTPAVGILLQIHARLKKLDAEGGDEAIVKKTAELARNFRVSIKELPFEIVSHSLSNAVTPIHPTTAKAYDIFTVLKDEYQIWICPNGGDLKDKVFRVGHLGALSLEDNKTLIDAFKDMQKRGLL